MAIITIKDLSDNTDLDRKAMQAISGGSRLRSYAGVLRPAQPQRIVDFRTKAKPGKPPSR
ncbi:MULTISPECIES: hypothetical protein [Massilia]|uniref:Uncharacterized protein n=1 Tax=Massilia orientalis TaxID=3050128 RepID=A0ACC7MIR8_9BURK|nr:MULTISPECIES: hypothetical protein [unclassified Massilia]KQY00028.1 hypothetical protein ASD28_11840 [Massilia sp. Root133]KQZ39242.1 hypothetical protein ASD92_05165 [Massilia sp. Root1485]MDN4046222.1 hypothetical protein [Massilia sp. YIM B02787]